MVEPGTFDMMLFCASKKLFYGCGFCIYLGICKIRTTFMQSTRNGVISGKKSEWQFWRLLIFCMAWLPATMHTPPKTHMTVGKQEFEDVYNSYKKMVIFRCQVRFSGEKRYKLMIPRPPQPQPWTTLPSLDWVVGFFGGGRGRPGTFAWN